MIATKLNSKSLSVFDKSVFGIIAVMLVVFQIMSIAGGLGIAPVAAILSGLGYLSIRQVPRFSDIPAWFWGLLIFLLWAFCTSFWSPHHDPDILSNPVKILLGLPIYLGTMVLFRGLKQERKQTLITVFLVSSAISLAVVFFELLTDYTISKFVNPVDKHLDDGVLWGIFFKNISHSITVAALLMPVVFACFVDRFETNGFYYGLLWAFLILLVSLLGGSAAGVLVVIVALPLVIVAKFRPLLCLKTAFALAILSIVISPLLGYFAHVSTEEFKLSLPLSWHHRVEIWGYTYELMQQNWVFGHGFDASRTFDGKYISRLGSSISKLSLHPHNAGLHIWLETGIVGVALASLALFLIYKATKAFLAVNANTAIAIVGLVVSSTMISLVSYGVWQDWWWAVNIIAASLILLLSKPAKS